jgi:hypothetical protein
MTTVQNAIGLPRGRRRTSAHNQAVAIMQFCQCFAGRVKHYFGLTEFNSRAVSTLHGVVFVFFVCAPAPPPE